MAPRFLIPAGAFGKRIGKNRSVQEGLDMKIVAGLEKNRSVQEALGCKKSVCSGRAGYGNRNWVG